MKKNKLLYIIFILLFVIASFLITYCYLIVNKKESGTIEVNNKYYDIVINNVYIEDSNVSVKVNNDNNNVNVGFTSLKNTNEFYIDLINIGNISKKVSLNIMNFNSNVDSNLIDIKTSLKDDEIIKGGETKRIYVTINYNNINNMNDTRLNFNVNFDFN